MINMFNLEGVYMNMDCAEKMLIMASRLVLKQSIVFAYSKEVSDEQVDLTYAFLVMDDIQIKQWESGSKREALERDLASLDRAKVYMLRTGTNGGPGHWQILYFDRSQLGWINYSSDKNQYLLTQNDRLTQQGETILVPHGKWGKNKGDYCMLVVEAKPEVIIAAANYLYQHRMYGEAEAINNCAKPKTSFYDGICVVEPKSSTILADSDQPSTVKLSETVKKELDSLHQSVQKISKHWLKKWFLPNGFLNKLEQYHINKSPDSALDVYAAFNKIGLFRRWLFSCFSIFSATKTVRDYDAFKKKKDFNVSQFSMQYLSVEVQPNFNASFVAPSEISTSEFASEQFEESELVELKPSPSVTEQQSEPKLVANELYSIADKVAASSVLIYLSKISGTTPEHNKVWIDALLAKKQGAISLFEKVLETMSSMKFLNIDTLSKLVEQDLNVWQLLLNGNYIGYFNADNIQKKFEFLIERKNRIDLANQLFILYPDLFKNYHNPNLSSNFGCILECSEEAFDALVSVSEIKLGLSQYDFELIVNHSNPASALGALLSLSEKRMCEPKIIKALQKASDPKAIINDFLGLVAMVGRAFCRTQYAVLLENLIEFPDIKEAFQIFVPLLKLRVRESFKHGSILEGFLHIQLDDFKPYTLELNNLFLKPEVLIVLEFLSSFKSEKFSKESIEILSSKPELLKTIKYFTEVVSPTQVPSTAWPRIIKKLNARSDSNLKYIRNGLRALVSKNLLTEDNLSALFKMPYQDLDTFSLEMFKTYKLFEETVNIEDVPKKDWPKIIKHFSSRDVKDLIYIREGLIALATVKLLTGDNFKALLKMSHDNLKALSCRQQNQGVLTREIFNQFASPKAPKEIAPPELNALSTHPSSLFTPQPETLSKEKPADEPGEKLGNAP